MLGSALHGICECITIKQFRVQVNVYYMSVSKGKIKWKLRFTRRPWRNVLKIHCIYYLNNVESIVVSILG